MEHSPLRPDEHTQTACWTCSATRLPECVVVMHLAGPGAPAPRHVVERPLLAATVTGACETALGGHRVEAGNATAWIEPGGESRSNRAGPSGARVLAIVPASDDLDLLGAHGELWSRPAQVRDPVVGVAAARAWMEANARDTVAPAALLAHILALVGRMARANRRERDHARRPSWVRTVRDVLHDRFREPLDLTALASLAGVDPAHLARTFRAHFGTTLGSYARGLRVAWAADRIAATNASLSEVALAAGFFDQSHFSHVFRRHLGTTPARFRRAMRQRT